MAGTSPLATSMEPASGVIPVVVVGGDEASGLADMLQQFIAQTLADSPRKVRQARSLAGRAVVRSAEDDAVCVCITFAGDQIELRDGAVGGAIAPSITADFLTMAHLTSGQDNPFRLLAQGKLKARFSVRQIPFLLRLLRFLQIESEARRATWPAWLLAAAAIGGGICWYVARMP